MVGSRWAPDPLDEAIKFRLPLATDTTTHFYFDRDPAAGVDRAWNNSTTAVYDGHTGSDFSGGPRGKPVYAAADGILVDRVDGFPDQGGSANGNYIQLNHGNDRSGSPVYSYYLHLEAGTPINLPLGSFIAAGTQVGGVGTSGNSTGLHLHFHLKVHNAATDPFAAAGETSWWANQGSGSPSTATPAPKFVVGQSVLVHSLGGGTLTVRSPDPTSSSIGTQIDGATGTILEGPALSFLNNDYDNNVYTRYKVQFANGMIGWAAQNWLQVVNAPEIGVAQGSTTIADGQATSLSFGSVGQGQSGPTRVFTVTNLGLQPLTLGAPSLPAGYTLTEVLSASLAAGASDTFTVRLDTAVAGTKTGSISISTNDGDENPFNFPITGTVTSGDSTAPTVDVVDITPDPRNSPLSSYTVVFSEPVLNFDKSDLLLKRNGGSISLTSEQTLATSDNITFTLNNLGSLTAVSGTYELTVQTSNITDVTGNALAGGASDSVKVQTSIFAGDANGVTADTYYVRRSSGGGANLEVFENVAPTGTPTYVLTFAGLTSLSIDTGGGGDALTIDYTNGDPIPAGAGGFAYGSSSDDALTVSGTGTFVLRQNSTISQLFFSGSGKVDLATNELVVTNGVLGTWIGTTYTALTVLVSVGRIIGTGGVGIADIGGDVHLRATRRGDADLDGVIDGDDFFMIDANVGMVGGSVSYAKGDFDLNGRIDADDYFMIDSNYNKPPVAPAPVAASMPPATKSGDAWRADLLAELQ